MATVNEHTDLASASQAPANGLSIEHPRFPGGGTPTWEIAYFFPAQGKWTEQDYLGIEDFCGGGIRAELDRGRLEVLPMPTQSHQLMIAFLFDALRAFVKLHAPGMVLFSGIRLRLANGTFPSYREPDLAYMKAENAQRRHEEFWEGADLVMEVVSGDRNDRQRDYVAKKKDYAEAKVAEYWIVDPDERRIQVFTLKDDGYQLHGDFRAGSEATSVLLARFGVAVADVLAAGK